MSTRPKAPPSDCHETIEPWTDNPKDSYAMTHAKLIAARVAKGTIGPKSQANPLAYQAIFDVAYAAALIAIEQEQAMKPYRRKINFMGRL